jgi:hypothetical protein
MKQCSSCGAERPLTAFGAHSNGKPRKQCKDCVTAAHYKRTYGITMDEYDTMYQNQKGVCKICSLPQKHKQHNRLCVDHDHQTGEVRGLLCDACNRGLGYFKDDERLLEQAIEYLRTT